MAFRNLVLIPLFFLSVALLQGCSTVGYFWQAAAGHIRIMADSEDIDKIIASPESSPELVRQLTFVKEIREFSVDELGLPDNRSYRVYSELDRQFPVWNVVAAPDDSLELKRWCFPFVGCISYKGYYSESSAIELGNELREAGMDVSVGGVPAYSTLGYTADPILSSFVNYPPGELARLIFHELAHQVVYIDDDTRFNESFATAVEELGVRAWLSAVGREDLRLQYERFDDKRIRFRELLADTREKLEAAYREAGDDRQARLAAKAVIIEDLRAQYESLKRDEWGGWSGYDNYFANDLNNAKLALAGLYNQHVGAFKALFARCEANFPRFYDSVAALGKLDRDVREEMLTLLSLRQPLPYALGCNQAMYVPDPEEGDAPNEDASQAD